MTARAGDGAARRGGRDRRRRRRRRAGAPSARSSGARGRLPHAGGRARRATAVLRLRAFVGRADGSAWVRDELTGADPEALGGEVARRLRAAGADEVLGAP